ncbi:hypothetical protein L9F63_014705 [Diploptera punctata]|uniref:Uncharacterized protein n=1 Tax=Diploptera punctata TaxID=6984 RepID=A0AAD8A8L7_DIPPU|nr:hypothetical protein L9F63_014705 [Diploptera punctata]
MADGEDNKKMADTESVSQHRDISWPVVLYSVHIHIGALFGIYYIFTEAKLLTTLFSLLLTLLAVLGATAGAHRLWAHRSYTANSTLRVILMLCQTLVLQGSIYDWVLDHRLHHKYFGTDLDPYNNKKGVLHAHFTTNLKKKHPEYARLAATIDMTDMQEDRIVIFQKRYYWLLAAVVGVLLPWNAPVEYWGEHILNSLILTCLLRSTIALHWAFLINSGIYIWGIPAGDKSYANSNLIFILTKSYWPQYHYLLPWDYQTGEYGNYGEGCTSTFIRIWAAMGWATGLRTMDTESIRNALITATDTKKPVIECLRDAENYSKTYNEKEMYLQPKLPL